MIFSFFYNFFLLILLIIFLPKFLKDFFIQGKYRKSIFSRIFPQFPDTVKQNVIWLHGVSLGETKALSTLVPYIRSTYPKSFIFVTTVTETGYNQASQSILDVDYVTYLPFDFSWIIKPFIKKVNPKLLVLVEGDYWMNLTNQVKNQGGIIVVVSAKISEKSMKRYVYFQFFCKKIFNSIDHFFVQNIDYANRFLSIGILPKKVTITGNLKLDIPTPKIDHLPEFRKELGIGNSDIVIAIGSTHEGEEELLLSIIKILQNTYNHLKILLVPRHPERFYRVKSLIRNLPNVILVDKMGVLSKCYALSNIAIVGGSFIEGIGGHDIFEPIKMGIPTFFGPFMDKQLELVDLVVKSGAGKMVSLKNLLPTLQGILSNKAIQEEMGRKGKICSQKSMGTATLTWKKLQVVLPRRL